MIRIANNRLLINEGLDPSFDIDSLHDRLAESLRACGNRNIWIADDILIALSSCINNSSSSRGIWHQDIDQIHASLTKVLQDNGLPNVAKHFNRSLTAGAPGTLQKKIDDVLQTFTHPVARNSNEAIMQKLLSLGYPAEKISALLIREISLMETQKPETGQTATDNAPHRLQDILPFQECYANWNWDFLQLRSAGVLFNSIRIEVYPLKLAQMLNFTPFMEMIFFSEWQKLIGHAAVFLENCLQNLSREHNQKIDYISIIMHDMESFTSYCELADDAPFFHDINHSLQAAFKPLLDFNNRQVKISKLL